jgi:hypothetical protein
MADRQLHARIAGLLYLIVVVSGIFSLAYVPGQLIVDGDIGATIANIVMRAPLYRLGILAGMICYTAFLLLPLAMYRLFAPWSPALAAAMVALATVSVPIAFGSLQSQMDLLALAEGSAGAAGNGQREALTALALQSSDDALRLVKLFWGLWLLPLGLLVLRSRLLPALLGVLLIAGCAGYLIDVVVRLLAPDALGAAARYVRLPATFGEIGTCLWLLIFGVREAARVPQPASSQP